MWQIWKCFTQFSPNNSSFQINNSMNPLNNQNKAMLELSIFNSCILMFCYRIQSESSIIISNEILYNSVFVWSGGEACMHGCAWILTEVIEESGVFFYLPQPYVKVFHQTWSLLCRLRFLAGELPRTSLSPFQNTGIMVRFLALENPSHWHSSLQFL